VKHFRQSFAQTLLAGVLFVLPVYLAIMLLAKAMKSLAGFVRPLAHLLPRWFPAETVLSFLFAAALCFLVGVSLRTRLGQATRTRVENALFQKIPGYTMFRSMTRQMVGDSPENTWKPALAEIEEALVPAFIVEELNDGRLAVFVPSVPTPLAGAIYILTAARVHPVDVPFTKAIKIITRWGSGSSELVAAMQSRIPPAPSSKAA
jgi:uncharacterized membrane protein